jgi:hypothetical protein
MLTHLLSLGEIGIEMNENPFILVFFNTWPSSLHDCINLNARTHNMMNISFIKFDQHNATG